MQLLQSCIQRGQVLLIQLAELSPDVLREVSTTSG